MEGTIPPQSNPAEVPVPADEVRDVQATTCCIVGGGPAGAVLALLLARRGIPVALLEAHKDFDRDFRGDTIHPSTLEVLDQLGLADRLLQIPHGTIRSVTFHTAEGSVQLIDLSRLKTPFPFIAMLPQVRFLEFITEEARRYASFRLVMNATVQRLVEEDGVVRGVQYRGPDGWHEVRAALTVGADGRFSRLRRLVGLEPIGTAPPMDVLWFRLPRRPGDPDEPGAGYIGGGRLVILLDRSDQWQVGYVIPKGGYQQLHAAGLEPFRRSIADLVPWLADRVDHLTDWRQVPVLSVESSRLPCWFRPGLLLIGDAAHVMSPVGGVGINYAIQDAVVAANLLAGPLRAGRVRTEDLAAVQRQRQWPTRVIQAFQGFVQRRLVAGALHSSVGPSKLPLVFRLVFRLPILRTLLPRLIAFGVRRVQVKESAD